MTRQTEITDLTICRAFFAAWVFLYHVDLYIRFSSWLGPFNGLIRRGYLGVDGFFLLSGFILAYAHPELGCVPTDHGLALKFSPRDTFIFWGKRLARIYPVHLVTLALLAAFFAAGLSQGLLPRDPGRFGEGAFFQNLLLVHGWGFANQSAWNYPSWSISTEWAGYLAFPLLWFLITYFDWFVAIQFMIIAFVALGLILTHYHSLNLTFSAGLARFFPEFTIGMCTKLAVPRMADMEGLRSFFLRTGLALIIIFSAVRYDLLTVLGIWMILAACAMRADAECPPFLNAPGLRWLGQLSYAFYMSFALAELIISQLFRHFSWPPATHAFIFAGGMLAITFALAVFLHIVVEKPCRRAADQWLEGSK